MWRWSAPFQFGFLSLVHAEEHPDAASGGISPTPDPRAQPRSAPRLGSAHSLQDIGLLRTYPGLVSGPHKAASTLSGAQFPQELSFDRRPWEEEVKKQ